MKRTADAGKLISNVLLAILAAVSVFLAGALSARYIVGGTGSDTARVAKWDVSATVTPPADPAKVILADGSTQTGNYAVAFTNNSEVAARASVELAGLPSGMTAYVRETPAGAGVPLASLTGWNIAVNGTKTVYIYFTAEPTVPSDKYGGITFTPVFTQVD